MQKKSLGLLTLATTLAAATVALTADDPAKARHEAMEQVGDAMKGLGKVAKGQAPFDATFVGSSATTIKEKLEQASKLFPPGSDTGETKAKPEVWSDRAAFDKAMQDGIAAATALAAVKEEGAFRPALGALGQNCKGCHDKYRMPEEH